MSIFEKSVEEIEQGDIENSVSEGIQEGKQIEYKEYLNLNDESTNQRVTLLAEVTSFANSNGGHLIVGVPDDEGRPQHAAGFQSITSMRRLIDGRIFSDEVPIPHSQQLFSTSKQSLPKVTGTLS